MSVVLISILTLVGLGVASALVLYMASKKFQVFEDPRIDQVEEVLPKSNCGGCGFPGCRAFAEALVRSEERRVGKEYRSMWTTYHEKKKRSGCRTGVRDIKV